MRTPTACPSPCLLTLFRPILVRGSSQRRQPLRRVKPGKGFPRTAGDKASMTMIFRADTIAHHAVYKAVVCGSAVMGFID